MEGYHSDNSTVRNILLPVIWSKWKNNKPKDEFLVDAFEEGLDLIEENEKSSPRKKYRKCKESRDSADESTESDASYIEHHVPPSATAPSAAAHHAPSAAAHHAPSAAAHHATSAEAHHATSAEAHGTSSFSMPKSRNSTDDESTESDTSYLNHHVPPSATAPFAAAHHAPSFSMPGNLPFMSRPTSMPLYSGLPAPPMLPQYSPSLASDPAVTAMAKAWYMAGYYTGIYSAGERNQGCHRCCNHSRHHFWN